MYTANGSPRIPPDIQTWLGHEWQGRRELMRVGLTAGSIVVAGAGLGAAGTAFGIAFLLGLSMIIAVMFTVRSGERFCGEIQLYMFLSSLWAAGFLCWSTTSMAWAKHLVVTMLVGLGGPAIMVLAWKHVRLSQHGHEWRRLTFYLNRHRPAEISAGPAPAAPPRPANKHKVLWEGMFANWSIRVHYCGEKPTPEGNRAVFMELPADGSVPFSRVADKAEGVAIALSGIGVTISPSAVRILRMKEENGQLSARKFVIMLDLVDILAKIRWMPEEHTRRSITEAFQIGVFQDGSPIYMTVQEIHWAIVALSRAGKSNLLHCIIYQVSRCYDAVIWMMDMKGGRTGKPWVRAWMDQAVNPATGKPVERPVIDWLAVDPHEAERMLRAFIAVAMARATAATGGSKTRASEENPHILLIAEEVSMLTGSHANVSLTSGSGGAKHSSVFGQLFTQAAALAAGEACTLIYANQRNTVDSALPGNAQANVAGRVCLGAADPQDVRMVLPKNPMAASVAGALRHKGSLVIASGPEEQALAGRAFFMGDDDELDRRTYEASLLHGSIVPGLRTGTLAYRVACEWGYQERWHDPERIGWLLGTGNHLGPWPGKPIEAKQEEPAAAVAAPSGPSPAAAKPAAGATGFFTPAAPRPQAPAPRTTGDPDFDQMVAQDPELRELADLVAAMEDPTAADTPAEPDDEDRVAFIVAFVDGCGTTGASGGEITAAMVAKGLITPNGRSAMYRYMKAAKDGTWGERQVVQPGGQKTRYYTRRHAHSPRRM